MDLFYKHTLVLNLLQNKNKSYFKEYRAKKCNVVVAFAGVYITIAVISLMKKPAVSDTM